MGSVPYEAEIREEKRPQEEQLPHHSSHSRQGLFDMLFWFCTSKMNSEALTATCIKQEDMYT